jgi:hypothetical protein
MQTLFAPPQKSELFTLAAACLADGRRQDASSGGAIGWQVDAARLDRHDFAQATPVRESLNSSLSPPCASDAQSRSSVNWETSIPEQICCKVGRDTCSLAMPEILDEGELVVTARMAPVPLPGTGDDLV